MPANEEVVLDVPSAEEIAQHYSAMGDSVDLMQIGLIQLLVIKSILR